MFRCEICGGVSASGEEQAVFVSATRKVTYPLRKKAYGLKEDPGGIGTEIAKEIRGHMGCISSFKLKVG